jgi:hypothetical protein
MGSFFLMTFAMALPEAAAMQLPEITRVNSLVVQEDMS